MDQEKTGKFIAKLRKEKGLTQSQLAEQFGISNKAVSKWENVKCLPDASIMIDLCNLLGITVNELHRIYILMNIRHIQLRFQFKVFRVLYAYHIDKYKDYYIIR